MLPIVTGRTIWEPSRCFPVRHSASDNGSASGKRNSTSGKNENGSSEDGLQHQTAIAADGDADTRIIETPTAMAAQGRWLNRSAHGTVLTGFQHNHTTARCCWKPVATQPSGILDRPVSIPPANRTPGQTDGRRGGFRVCELTPPTTPSASRQRRAVRRLCAAPAERRRSRLRERDLTHAPHNPVRIKTAKSCPALMRRPRGAATSVACVSANVLREPNRARPYSRPTQPGR